MTVLIEMNRKADFVDAAFTENVHKLSHEYLDEIYLNKH